MGKKEMKREIMEIAENLRRYEKEIKAPCERGSEAYFCDRCPVLRITPETWKLCPCGDWVRHMYNEKEAERGYRVHELNEKHEMEERTVKYEMWEGA